MKAYTLLMRIEVGDDEELTPDLIKNEIYDACPDVPFGFDITSIREETCMSNPEEAPARTVHMLSDQNTPLIYTSLDKRSYEQLLIDAGAFASRMGNLHPHIVSIEY